MTTDVAQRGELHHSPESRYMAFSDAEVRMDTVGSGMTFRGYASIFDAPYPIHDQWGEYEETVTRSAFDSTIAQGADCVLLVNHDGPPLARTKSGTLSLRTDKTGLLAEARLDPANPLAVSVRSMVDRGDLDEMSFTFRDLRPSWNAAYTERSLKEVSLHHGDVALVNFAANPATKGTLAMRARSQRAQLSTAEMNDLPDSAFAYIEPGGTKDSEGKTVPRSKRHFAIHDAAHVRNALARIAQGAAFGKQAMPKVLAAAKKFGIEASESKSLPNVDRWARRRIAELRSPLHPKFTGSHSHRHPANRSQGNDKTHAHEHSHDNDNAHDHHDSGLDNADVASSQTEDPTATVSTSSSLGLPNFDIEARIAILRAKGREWDWARPLTDSERWALDVAWREQEAAKRAAARRRKRAADFYGKWVP